MKVFKIDGEPVAQARARLGRGGFVYDPNCRDKMIIQTLLNQNRTWEKFVNPRISFMFVMPIPKSTNPRLAERYRRGMIKHCKKPDIDNLVKLYLDCMDGIIFEGDQNVSLGECIKVYGTDPATLIYIQSTNEEVSIHEINNLSLAV